MAEDAAMILQAMGIKSCVSSSTSGCVTAQGGWGSVSAKACAGTESSAGCEQIVANFKKTRIVKEALTCAINNRINDSSNQTGQSNIASISLKNSTCCTCLEAETCDTCSAVGSINQSNVADIKVLTEFTVDEAKEVQKTISTAIVTDILTTADSQKDGLGTTSGQKVINTDQVESITTDEDLSLTNSIQKSLNILSQTNEYTLEIDGVNSYGSCMDNLTQANLVDMVVESIMKSSLESIKNIVDESTYETIIDTMATKKDVGTCIDCDPPMGGLGSMMAIVALAGIAGFVYLSVKGAKGTSGAVSSSIKSLPPKARIVVYLIVAILFVYLLWWIITGFSYIKSVFKSLNPMNLF